MAILEDIIFLISDLPAEKQSKVRQAAKSLKQTESPPRPSKNWLGMCEDEGCHVTEVDIAEARREMWSGFPRSLD